MAAKYITPKGRVSFPQVFVAKAAQGSNEPKFQLTLLLSKNDPEVQKFIATVQAGVQEQIAAKWPNPQSRPAAFKFGIKDGDTVKFDTGVNTGKFKKEKYPEMAGCYIIQASSKQRPGIVDANGQPIMNEADFYAGCYARVSFNLFAFQNVNVGVSCGLQNVQKLADGERLGSAGSSPEEDFGAAPGVQSAAQTAAWNNASTPAPAAGFAFGGPAPTAPANPQAAAANLFA